MPTQAPTPERTPTTTTASPAAPDPARYTFAAAGRWVAGAHSRSIVRGFRGGGHDLVHRRPTTLDADHPVALGGGDEAPTPLEHLLHALVASLTAGVADVAAARGLAVTSVACTAEGDVDLHGTLALPGGAIDRLERVRVRVVVRGGDPDALVACIEQARRRSAVLGVVAHGVPVVLCVDAG